MEAKGEVADEEICLLDNRTKNEKKQMYAKSEGVFNLTNWRNCTG